MRKKRIFIATFALLAAFTTGVVAKNTFDIIKAEIRTDFVIEIDGEAREFKNAQGERVYPLLHDGTTYLPLRAISEIMGKAVYWYESEKRIEIKDEKKNDAPTVTDADVIIDSTEKNEKPAKPEKTDKEKVPYDESKYIGKEKAKVIALEKAGFTEADVDFIKAELDKDDGTVKYEVEFKKGTTEYEADINAETGEILKWKKDLFD